MKCLDDERKTNEKLDKRLYEFEMKMFGEIVKDLKSQFVYCSEKKTKLCKLFYLYSALVDLDKNLEDLNLWISKFKEMTEEV